MEKFQPKMLKVVVVAYERFKLLIVISQGNIILLFGKSGLLIAGGSGLQDVVAREVLLNYLITLHYL